MVVSRRISKQSRIIRRLHFDNVIKHFDNVFVCTFAGFDGEKTLVVRETYDEHPALGSLISVVYTPQN